MVDVNAGSAAALELALLDVPQLTSYARRVIVQQRPFATFADMAKRVNAGLPPTSNNRLPAKLAKHFRFDDGGARERNAEYGRELVGLNIHIPWSAWDGYPDGSGFEAGTVFQYQSPDAMRADRASRHRTRALASASRFPPPPAARPPSLPPGP